MKRTMVFVLAAMLIALPCLAQQQAPKASEEFTGTVDSINPIDPSRGNDEGSIYVRDDLNNIPMFIINTATVLTDASSGKIESADITDGDTVKLTYSTTDMGKIANTITRTAVSEKKGIRLLKGVPLLDKTGL